MNKGTGGFIPKMFKNRKAVELVFDQAFYKLVPEDGTVDLDYLRAAQKKIAALKK